MQKKNIIRLFFRTCLTETVKLYPVPIYLMMCKIFKIPVQFFINRHLQINNRSAPLAYEMVVGIDIRVKPIKCAPEVDPSCQSLLDQYIEIAVHGPGAQAGKLFLEPVVYPYRRWMRTRALQ